MKDPMITRLRARARDGWSALPERFRRVAPYLAVLLAGLVIGGTLFGRSGDSAAHDGVGIAGHEGHDHGDASIEWTCSMHPQIRQPGPGSCPICGMDLIPVATGDDGADHGDLPRLTVSDRAAALMDIQVWPAERRPTGDAGGEVRLAGSIAYDETRVHDIALRTEGQVERLLVNYEQAAVRQGQRIADIYSPAILTASQELIQARRAAERGGPGDLVEAAAAQLLALGVSRAQIDRIIETGQPARTYSVYSPASGVVTELAARQGEWLGAGGRVMRVAGVDRVWAQFEAFERDLAHLRVGGTVRFTVDAYPGEVFAGDISFIDPTVDAGRRTARVRVQVPNTDGRLRPGMLARGQAAGGGAVRADAPLVIPATAPLLTGRRAIVYVRLPDFDRPTFEAREVTLGARDGQLWQVADGLAEGDLVVVNGAFRIDSELQIRGRPSMMGVRPPGYGPDGPGGDTDRLRLDVGSEPVRLSAEDGRRLETAVRAYLDLSGALAHDNADNARRHARALDGALDQAALAGLSGDAAREWNRVRREMRGRATAIAATADIDVQRRAMLPLSHLLEAAVTTYRSDQVGTLFRAMCPMVDGGEGHWLTREAVVENPYHGSGMFSCGEVQDQVAG